MLEGLGKDDLLHHDLIADAEGFPGFPLPLVNRLDARADQLRLIGTGVAGERNETDKIRVGTHPHAGDSLIDHGNAEIEEQHLKQCRSAPEYLNVNICDQSQKTGSRALAGGEDNADHAPDHKTPDRKDQ